MRFWHKCMAMCVPGRAYNMLHVATWFSHSRRKQLLLHCCAFHVMQWSVPARLTRPLRAACSAPALLNSIKRARTRKNGCTRARRADRCTTDADRQAGRQMQAGSPRSILNCGYSMMSNSDDFPILQIVAVPDFIVDEPVWDPQRCEDAASHCPEVPNPTETLGVPL